MLLGIEESVALSIILTVTQLPLVFIVIFVSNGPAYELPRSEITLLCGLPSVPYPLPVSAISLEIPLIDLMCKYFPAMVVLESILKLPYVFESIGDEDSVSMDGVVLPFSDILDPIIIFSLH